MLIFRPVVCYLNYISKVLFVISHSKLDAAPVCCIDIVRKGT